MTQRDDGFGGALGGDHIVRALRFCPGMCHRHEFGTQFVFAGQPPILIGAQGVMQVLPRKVMKGLLHRVVRFDLASEHDKTHEFVIRRGQGAQPIGRQRMAVDRERGNLHPVFGQRTGFVDAEHGGLAQRFDGVEVARQHSMLCNASRAQRKEHDHDDRKLLRQGGHGERNAGQDAF